jgi:hypothetical protein
MPQRFEHGGSFVLLRSELLGFGLSHSVFIYRKSTINNYTAFSFQEL